MNRISIIIVNFNGLIHTRKCLETLFRFHSASDLEVIVVDNHSHDGSVEKLRSEYPQVNVIALKENYGFGYANNAGAKDAAGELLFFVNNDTVFTQETAAALASHLTADEKRGIVGPKLMNEDRSFQVSFGHFPSILTEYRMKQMMNDAGERKQKAPAGNDDLQVDWVTGAAFMIRKSLYDAVRGFDERYFLYFEDIDLNKRVANAGYDILLVPSVALVHLGGRSYGSMNPTIAYEYRRSQLRYYDAHNSFMQSIIVRCYIAIKYLPKLFSAESRAILRIMGLLTRRQ